LYLEDVKKEDPEVFSLIEKETNRQKFGLVMIASENHASKAVLEAMATPLSNKYSEGYPNKRYCTGNQFIDQMETLAIERAKKLFNMAHANVQPHSGSQANAEVYFALLKPGDKVLGMNLCHGGHLTHGNPVNFSGILYDFSAYGVEKESERIDMDKVRQIAEKEKPKLIVSGATAYPREIDFKEFAEIAKDVGAYSLADIAHVAGLILAGAHSNCSPYTDVITTTTHKTLRGPRSALILCKEEHAKAIDKAVFPGQQGGPMEHIIAAKAVCFKEAMQPEFKEYQQQIIKNAKALAEVFLDNGFRLISGGTDNHLILMDVTPLGITGRIGSDALAEAEIYTNRNTIPFETRSPFDPSGIRIGTPALTTRGMKENEIKQAGEWIVKILRDPQNKQLKEKIKEQVRELCIKYPLYE